MLTTEPPDPSVYWHDNAAEIRQWLDVERRSQDTAFHQLQALPPTKWLRDLWLNAAGRSSEQAWDLLPELIRDAVLQGEELSPGVLAFLIRISGEEASAPAIAALRSLGMLVEEYSFLDETIARFLETGLQHSSATVRVAAAEAIWTANLMTGAEVIRRAAASEKVPGVKEYMLHAARLLSGK